MPDEDQIAGRTHTVGSSLGFSFGDLDAVQKSLKGVRDEVDNLKKSLDTFAQAAPGISSKIQGALSAVSGASTGGNSGGSTYNNGGASSSGGGRGLTSFAKDVFGSVNSNGWIRDLMLFPMRFMNSQITNNRDLAMSGSGVLGPQAFASGTPTASMLTALAGNFGNVLGGPEDLLSLQQIAGQVGAGVDWRFYGNNNAGRNGPPSNLNAPRAGGFFRSVGQAQRINPYESVNNIAGAIGGYVGNVGAQQAGTFLTGGAFSMLGAGGGMKDIPQWAEGILKFLQDQRPGNKRGQKFTYGELMSQNFPGSNIDVWLTVNGVPANMKQYFWSYAMAKANAGNEDIFGANYAPVQQNPAFQRLQAVNAQTTSGFKLAGTMSNVYSNKEQANRWFSDLMGSMMQQVLPAAVSSQALGFVQFLPDAIQEMLMSLMERTNVGAIGGAMMGWGSLFPEVFSGLSDAGGGLSNVLGGLKGLIPGGDVGDDVGDWGPMGSTSTAGMHPDMRKRVDAMMAANPRLRVTSGYRDLAKQQTLRRKGVGRVSGRPSAHTRGRAADMGPSSEYGWITANAGRFGLKSGIGAGEPWHVGIGDPAPTGGGLSDILTSIFGQFGNIFSSDGAFSASDQMTGVATGTSAILKMIMALFGGKDVNQENLAFRDVYHGMGAITQQALQKGLIFPTVAPSGSAAGGSTGTGAQVGPGGELSMQQFFSQVLQKMGAPTTRSNLDKLASVARQEGNVASFNPWNFNTQSNGSVVHIGKSGKPNPANVQDYPDWMTGVNVLANQLSTGNRSKYGITSAIMQDSSFGTFINAVNSFYASWPGGGTINISQGSADAYLGTTVHGAGDLDYMLPTGGGHTTNMNFHNQFVIAGGGGGGSNQGIDIRRAASQIADQLETEMKKRMARNN